MECLVIDAKPLCRQVCHDDRENAGNYDFWDACCV